jgi:hypothetical protein
VRAYYSSCEVKAENAAGHGVVGVIGLDDPVLERLNSFHNRVRDLAFPDMWWLNEKGQPNNYNPEVKANVSFSLGVTTKFF